MPTNTMQMRPAQKTYMKAATSLRNSLAQMGQPPSASSVGPALTAGTAMRRLSNDQIQQEGNRAYAESFAAGESPMRMQVARMSSLLGPESGAVDEQTNQAVSQRMRTAEEAQRRKIADLMSGEADFNLRGQTESADAQRKYEDSLLARQTIDAKGRLRIADLLTGLTSLLGG